MQKIVEGGADKNEIIEDATVYESGQQDQAVASSTSTAGAEALKYTVKNPHTHSGHIVYEVCGTDKHGEWSGLRRFNEFFVLH